MPTKKATAKKSKGGSRARRRRNPEGVSLIWGNGDSAVPRRSDGKMKARATTRKRNPAVVPEAAGAAPRINELTLRAWELTYANRNKRLTD